ncbi:unnamed protein product [Rhizophagus irregularis]|nr:unnamed protein product [Rhizophagus irregularis]
MNTSSDFINDSSLKELTQEADGLPILCIELPNISIEIIDSLLQWLFNNDEVKFDDILTSTLASNIKSTLDFFDLLDEISKDNEWETLSLTTGDIGPNLSENSKSDILEWLNSSSVITPTPRRVLLILYFSSTKYPSSPAFKRIIPRSLPRTPKTTTFTKSIIYHLLLFRLLMRKIFLERDDILEDVPLTAGLTVPPNTPNVTIK